MKKTLFVLSLCGVLFSGYLSSVKFFTKTCALGETCPLFWGYPACYFGFGLFLLLLLLSGLLLFGTLQSKHAHIKLCIVAFFGIMFAGYFTVGELPILFAQGFSAYVFGLPTCALGLIFFLLIFFISCTALEKHL